jgi:excisionase family DNA binding protein
MIEKQVSNEIKHLRNYIDERFDKVEFLIESLESLVRELSVPRPELEEKEYLNTNEACEFLQLAPSTFARYLKLGKIKYTKVGAKLNRFRRSDLIAFRDSN